MCKTCHHVHRSLGLVMMTAAAAIWLTSAAHAGGKGSGRADVKEITVTKQTDVSSQSIMRKSSTGNATNKQRFDPYKNFKFR
jgi:hypothetical protein